MAVSAFAIILVLIVSLGNGIGSVFFKKAAEQYRNIWKLILNPLFIIGVIIYGVAAMLYVVALKHGDITILYPLAAMQYVWVCVLAVIVLKEKMNALKWAGVMLIVAGAAFIGFGL